MPSTKLSLIVSPNKFKNSLASSLNAIVVTIGTPIEIISAATTPIGPVAAKHISAGPKVASNNVLEPAAHRYAPIVLHPQS